MVKRVFFNKTTFLYLGSLAFQVVFSSFEPPRCLSLIGNWSGLIREEKHLHQITNNLLMYRLLFVTFSMLMVACNSPQMPEHHLFTAELEALQALYAPDKRTDRVELEVADKTITGYTTRPEVLDSISRLVMRNEGWAHTVRLLPNTAKNDQTVGLIKVSVANLRSKPGHSQELATQALMGTPVQVLEKQGGWCLVRTPDRYIAWLEPGAFVAVTPAQAKDWLEGDLRLYQGTSGEIRSEPGGGIIISAIEPGGLLKVVAADNAAGFIKVRLPDGASGWLPEAEMSLLPDYWWQPETVTTTDLLEVAAGLAGRPYLWGGTSPNGMDCSGFTKMSYYFNGYVIPRDASQQVKAGEEVPITEDFSNLQPGDQLFFGSYRDDGSEKITHTGFYLGNGRFLHAGADNGRIRENSLIKGEEGFAAHRLSSLMRARRLSAGTTGVVPMRTAFNQLLK